ncbi:MAG: glycoside hydrolase family 57 protein [Planctomycetota bacterium]
MASICIYFQVHQPFRLRRFSVFERGSEYFDTEKNRELLGKVAQTCYLPTNALIADLIARHGGRFRLAFSLSGVALEQMRDYAPDVLESFQRLAATGAVEFLAETYHHSLSFIYSPEEFVAQVERQRALVEELFSQSPRAFRNTELIYNNTLARVVAELGYRVILCEGADHLLGYHSPAYLYNPPGSPDVSLLLKNYRLSDHITAHFGNQQWREWPLTAEKFARWIHEVNEDEHVVNLFMDYETFGERHQAETGIFDFLRHLPARILRLPNSDFKTPSECAAAYPGQGEFDVPHMISWAETERDVSAWLGNAMQSNALHQLYRLEAQVKQSGDEVILENWRRLQTSDHFYYMCTKQFVDGDYRRRFNPYDSPYDSFINFMNVLDNLRARLA